MVDRLKKILLIASIACSLAGFSLSTASAATPEPLDINAGATRINRMTITMGRVYFYLDNSQGSGNGEFGSQDVFRSVNASCTASITRDPVAQSTLVTYTLTYSATSQTGVCGSNTTKTLNTINNWDDHESDIFASYDSNIVSTKANITTPFVLAGTYQGKQVYMPQGVDVTTCPTLIVNSRTGSNPWRLISLQPKTTSDTATSMEQEFQALLAAVPGGNASTNCTYGNVDQTLVKYGLYPAYQNGRDPVDFGFGFGKGLVKSVMLSRILGSDGIGLAGAGPNKDLAAGSIGGTTSGDKETCNVSGIGWIVCPLAVFIGKTTDAVYTLIEQLLVYNIPNALGDNPLKTVWSNILGIANVAFIIAFFAVILSQATSIGISNYGVKKILPRMIAAAILVNLSYYICIFAVDISNIIGAGIDGILMSALPSTAAGTINGVRWETAVGGALALTATYAFAPAIIAAAITFSVPALLAVLTTLLILTARYAIVTLLIAISPLAFVAFILPNTEGLFDKWRKLFMTMLVFYPMVALLFAGSKVAAYILLLQ